MQVLCLTIVSSLLGTLDQECGRLQGAGGGFVPASPLSASGGDGVGVVSIITPTQFDEMLKHRNDSACPAKGFYTYDAFTRAANSFPGFATSGDFNTRKREVAAFLAQTSSETTGGWEKAPDGPYAWGYCYIEEQGNPSDYCGPSLRYPCVSGEKYYGRGPFQISYNYNYGEAGEAIGVDLLKKPALVATDATISFKTALWFWMTPQPPKPSCHAVITGNWTPSDADRSAGRLPGYGLITNLIDGGVECGKGKNAKVEDRIGFYKRYCDILGVSYGNNIDCYAQSTFPSLNF